MSSSPRIRHRPGILDLLRREWYMTRLDWSLRELRSRESRRIRRDLRRNLKDSAAHSGMRPALADLGTPGALAAEYTTDADLQGPRYATGALAAGLTLAAVVFLFVAYAVGTLDTLVATGGGTRSVKLWGSETVLVGSASEMSMEMTGSWLSLGVALIISAIVFLVFSRSWRLFRSA